MEGKYIVAIIVLAAFFLLILVAFAFLERTRKKEENLNIWIEERNANKELNKFNYDTVNTDEDVGLRSVRSMQETEHYAGDTQEEDDDNVQLSFEDAYGKIEVEGIEEITGNYNGGK